MKVVLCGYNWAGCKALNLLLQEGNEVFVYTHESPYYVNDLQEYCIKKNVPFSLAKITASNLPFKPDVIVSIYYRYIISKKVIDACEGKIFNLHPSLLPRYRGCSSLTWAMINGESVTGFTYHYINEGVDIGNIILQKEVMIEEFDTQQSLYFKVMFKALDDLLFVFDQVISGVAGEPQVNISADEYYKRGCPNEGLIDATWDDERKERFIRAMIYPPLPPAKHGEKDIFSFRQYRDLLAG